MSEQDTPERDGPESGGEAEGEKSEAVTLADSHATEDAPVTGTREPKRLGMGFYALVVLALAFAFFSASTSGYLWWQYRQFNVTLDQADTESAMSIQDVRATLRSVEDRIQLLQEVDGRADAIAREHDRRLQEFPGRFQVLEQRLNVVQGISDDARRQWIRAEAEYYLVLANTELMLGGRWQSAIDALELADAKLTEEGNPVLGGVRQLISGELQALRGVRLPDVEGLSYSLGGLAERVQSLPMQVAVPTGFATGEEALQSAEPGLGRIWLTLKEAVTGMISIERSEVQSHRALTAEEQALVRRQLELELEMARLGLLRAQTGVFQISLSTASALLTREFDNTDSTVESAIALIEDISRLDIDPTRPDISGSLSLLRELSDREG
jgi:uroporphyrin-3 C-methyltransferase